jgi:hypothetical protein
MSHSNELYFYTRIDNTSLNRYTNHVTRQKFSRLLTDKMSVHYWYLLASVTCFPKLFPHLFYIRVGLLTPPLITIQTTMDSFKHLSILQIKQPTTEILLELYIFNVYLR